MIHPSAIIHPSAVIGDHVEIGPFCIIKENSKIGNGCTFESNVVVGRNTIIGENNHFYHGAVVGSDPLDKSYQGEESYLIIGDHNTIREYCNISRGTANGGLYTQIGNDNLIMNYAHIGHDAFMGDYNVIVNNVQIGGHVEIEDYVTMGCASGVHQRCKIGRLAMIGAGSKVTQDIVPYSLADGPRSYIHGINMVGLKRNGYSNEQIKMVKTINNILFRQQLSLSQSMDAIQNLPDSEFKDHTLQFLSKSSRGIARMKQPPSEKRVCS